MLEVVFDKNIATGLRMAKDSRPGDKRFSVKAGIYSKGTPPELREPPRQETWVWSGKELEGSSADVALLMLALDMGDLSGGGLEQTAGSAVDDGRSAARRLGESP